MAIPKRMLNDQSQRHSTARKKALLISVGCTQNALSHLPFFRQRAESLCDLCIQVIEELLEVVIGILRHLELHLCQLNDVVLQLTSNCVPADLMLACTLCNCFLGMLMKTNNVSHHTNGLGQRA